MASRIERTIVQENRNPAATQQWKKTKQNAKSHQEAAVVQ
jgi:hypothetical protein